MQMLNRRGGGMSRWATWKRLEIGQVGRVFLQEAEAEHGREGDLGGSGDLQIPDCG